MRKINTKHAGFTLLETIIAIAVISLVITAAAQLVQSSTRIGGQSMKEFIAYHLAEEGLEVVRNLRDTNWLSNVKWRKGLEDGLYVIDENSAFSGINEKWTLRKINSQDQVPEIVLNENEKFKRTIEIKTEDETRILVKSNVNFIVSLKTKSASIETILTNWKKGPL